MREAFDLVSPSHGVLWTSIPIIALLLIGASFFGHIVYSAYHTSLVLTEASVSIKGALYACDIKYAEIDIEHAGVINLNVNRDLRPEMRTNGIGMWGYQSGWFKLANGRKALVHVTKKDQVLYLPTRGKFDVLVSVKDPDRLLDQLKVHTKQSE